MVVKKSAILTHKLNLERDMFFENTQKFNDKVFTELVSNGMTVGVSNMLEQGEADANELDENGKRPIVIAAYRGDLAMVKLLVEHGAQVNIKDSFGVSPMMWAKKNKNTELISYLEVEKEKQVNIPRR